MATIVVYDSGVGGLTIYQEIVNRCTNNDIIFVSDNDAFPYGTKAEFELVDRVHSVVKAIARQYAPDVLVVACNTASTVALPVIRESVDFDVVGVVPAIKPAAQSSANKRFALLATPGTISRQYTHDLISRFASECDVVSVGSSELVQLAEDKLQGKAVDLSKINAILMPIIVDKKIDVLVLACTHFPLLNNEIESILKANFRKVKLLDSGLAIAQRVEFLLNQKSELSEHSGRIAAFTKAIDQQQCLNNLSAYQFSECHNLIV